MKRSKGFTLIELLAVIVILAVIALIAVPQVLSVLSKSRKEAFIRSAEGVLKASELTYSNNLLLGIPSEAEIYSCNNNECLLNNSGNNSEKTKLDMKGNVGNGQIKIYSTGEIEFKITNGEYCAAKYKNDSQIYVENGICENIDFRSNGSVKLSENTGNYTYPTEKSFEVIENLSGGELSCESDDEEVATCFISGTTVTVTPGTKEGIATLTIISSGTDEYKDAQAAYLVTTQAGLLSVTANDYSGIYDGVEHGITVSSSDAIISYGMTDGTYDLETNPLFVDAGSYTVFYQVVKSGYTTVTGSKTVTITKAPGSATLSATSGSVYAGNTTSFNVSNSTGAISCASSNLSVAKCSVSGTFVTVTGVAAGNATITVNIAESTNYTGTSKTYSATIINQKLSNLVKVGDYVSMQPTSTSYTISTSLTGYSSSQTINPSELKLWRVISINSDGTIDMVSEYVSSKYVYFSGQSAFLKYVGTMKTIAEQYKNSSYTVATRPMGYNGQTLTITNTSKFNVSSLSKITTVNNNYETLGGGDILYQKDTGLVTDALGTLAAKTPSGTAREYWLASRYYLYDSVAPLYTWAGRFVKTDGSHTAYKLYFYWEGWDEDGWDSVTTHAAIRPIVTLKSGITATGSGTKSSPWVLK